MIAQAPSIKHTLCRENRALLLPWQLAELKALETGANDKILDLNCANGALLRALNRLPRRILCGLAETPEQARQLREEIDSDVLSSSPEDLPWKSQTFDAVLCGVLHKSNAMPIINEAARVLKPGGKMVAAVPCFTLQADTLRKNELGKILAECALETIVSHRSGLYAVIVAEK